MTPEQQKEQFSIAYVRAVAATARVNVSRPEVDDDSVDIRFSIKSIEGAEVPPMLEAQLKCSSAHDPGGESIRYPLKLKNYNDLRGKHFIPRVLIVVITPAAITDWLVQDEQQMVLRKCAYWVSLEGMPERDNASKVTIHVPRAQRFSTNDLQKLLGQGGTT
jgi:hypothetical protein